MGRIPHCIAFQSPRELHPHEIIPFDRPHVLPEDEKERSQPPDHPTSDIDSRLKRPPDHHPLDEAEECDDGKLVDPPLPIECPIALRLGIEPRKESEQQSQKDEKRRGKDAHIPLPSIIIRMPRKIPVDRDPIGKHGEVSHPHPDHGQDDKPFHGFKRFLHGSDSEGISYRRVYPESLELEEQMKFPAPDDRKNEKNKRSIMEDGSLLKSGMEKA